MGWVFEVAKDSEGTGEKAGQSLARGQKGALQKKRAGRDYSKVRKPAALSQQIEQMLANGLTGLLVGGKG